MRRAVAAAPGVAAALLVVSCACVPATDGAPGPACAAAGERCQLPDGPLGVCTQAACPEGARAPCFACAPQH